MIHQRVGGRIQQRGTAGNNLHVSVRLHREADGPHHHIRILWIYVFIDDNDDLVSRVHTRGSLESLLGFTRMTLGHSDHPPIPSAAHFRTANLHNFRQIEALLEKVVEHHVATGTRYAVGFTRWQPDENSSKNRVAPVRDSFYIDDRAQAPFRHEVAGIIAERLAALHGVKRNFPFDNDFRFSRNFEWNCFAGNQVDGASSDRPSDFQFIKSIRKIGGGYIIDVRQGSQNDGYGQRLAALYRSRVVIEHRVMGACDAGDEFVSAAEMTAVHADVSQSSFGIFGNKRRREADPATKARLFHWRR